MIDMIDMNVIMIYMNVILNVMSSISKSSRYRFFYGTNSFFLMQHGTKSSLLFASNFISMK